VFPTTFVCGGLEQLSAKAGYVIISHTERSYLSVCVQV
jgi:hypothetical protein